MGVDMKFDFRDIFRAGRIGFSAKKILSHFVGLLLAYVIYEVIFYITLLISDASLVGEFWGKFGVNPVWPFTKMPEGLSVPILSQIGMWVGLLVAFIIFFTTSLMVSKITIEQLRGDEFFSAKDALKFAKKKWLTLFLAFASLILMIVLAMIWPLAVALLSLIPKGVGNVILMLSSFMFIPAFFLGLAIAYSAVVVVVSLFFAPSITAVEDSDAFEVIYQEFRMLWGQPWRMLIYQLGLVFTKAICGSIYAIMSFAGLGAILLMPALIVPTKTGLVLGRAGKWLGISDLAGRLGLGVYEGSGILLGWIAAILTTITLIFVIGMIVSYVASIASVGSTMIYVILRKRHDDENLLEVEEEEDLTIEAEGEEEKKEEEGKKEDADQSSAASESESEKEDEQKEGE